MITNEVTYQRQDLEALFGQIERMQETIDELSQKA